MAEKGQDFEWTLNVVGCLSFEKVSGSITLRRKQKIAGRFSADRGKVDSLSSTEIAGLLPTECD
jgi:hypothetical protein